MYRAEPLKTHTQRWPASVHAAMIAWAKDEDRSMNKLVEAVCLDALARAERLPAPGTADTVGLTPLRSPEISAAQSPAAEAAGPLPTS